MRSSRWVGLGLLWMMVATSSASWAEEPVRVLPRVRASLLAANSIQFKLMAYLASGDIAGAIAMYETETGGPAPSWLTQLQGAYALTNQAAGSCQQVARVIHTAFLKLGQAPQYIAFKVKGDEEFMVFELMSGRNAPVSQNGYHVAVRLGDLIYDAYTGPLGMKLTDYLSRLHAVRGVTWTQVVEP